MGGGKGGTKNVWEKGVGGSSCIDKRVVIISLCMNT